MTPVVVFVTAMLLIWATPAPELLRRVPGLAHWGVGPPMPWLRLKSP